MPTKRLIKETAENDDNLKKKSKIKSSSNKKGASTDQDIKSDSKSAEQYKRTKITEFGTNFAIINRAADDSKIVTVKPFPIFDSTTDNDPLEPSTATDESSSESTDYSQYYQNNQEDEDDRIDEADLILTEPELFLETDIFSEEESSVEDELDYLKQNDLEQQEDFFHNLGEVPQVDELSIDLSDDIVIHLPKDMGLEELIYELDTGKFVNPLTGISSSTETDKSSKEEENMEIAEEENDQDDQENFDNKDNFSEVDELEQTDLPDESLDLKDIEEPLELEHSTQQQTEAATFDQFLELETQKDVSADQEIEVEILKREELNLQSLQTTQNFLNDLIDLCIKRCEYLNPQNVLRQNLDKHKILQDLQMQLTLLEQENIVNKFLNRKTVEHFRRKRSFRSIMEDNPKTLNHEMEKYSAAIKDLDNLLRKEQEIDGTSSTELAVLKDQVAASEEQVSQELLRFENTVKQNLKRENFNKLQVFTNNSLTEMSEVRKEISKVRFNLILKQHKVALLEEQLHDLEDLGNGLNMRNFENIQTETQALGKKIEERNSELQKLHHHCNTDIHSMAHLKEKQKMLRATIAVQRQYLAGLQDDKEDLRESIHLYKLKRNRLRREMRELSFQSGLLDKPVLMQDYDGTVENIEKLSECVNDLKSKVKQLNSKLARLEMMKNKRKSIM